MQPHTFSLKSFSLLLVVLMQRSTTQALSIMQSQSMLHIYSALQGGIEYTALPTGEYLDIDSPCSLIAVVKLKA